MFLRSMAGVNRRMGRCFDRSCKTSMLLRMFSVILLRTFTLVPASTRGLSSSG